MASRAAWILIASIGLLPVSFTYLARSILLNANRLGRKCSSIPHTNRSLSNPHTDRSPPFSFAIVSCSDDLDTVPQRSFHGMMELVSPNKIGYAELHRYSFFDASDVLDKDRPPSWSKIKAVRKYLGSYDWIFWNDADSLVTNFGITLEDVLKSTLKDMKLHEMPELIITEDVNGVNAGMFFMRDSAWTREFLNRWWNQTSFIKPFGESKSGDNDALKFLLKTMPKEEKQQHVHVAHMQCLFNSYLWLPSWKNIYRLITKTRAVWQGAYSYGDFMLHLAGVDNKKFWIEKFLNRSSTEETVNLWTH